MNRFRKKLKDRRAIHFYKGLIPAGSFCFDVGAHKGEVSTYLLKAGMQVVAVEPLPECMDVLYKIQLKYRELFTIVPMGVASIAEERPFYKANLKEVSSFSKEFMDAYGKYAYLNWEEDIRVQCTTLNDLIVLYGAPYFMKLDIEGYEMEAVKSLDRPIQVLQFEWNQLTIEIAIAVVEHLKKLGNYKYNWWPREDFRWKEKELLSPESLITKLSKEKDIWLTGEIVAFLQAS